jgi:N-acetylglucosaminyl-diphospho-decaprenol L-rhamnosyltransferase
MSLQLRAIVVNWNTRELLHECLRALTGPECAAWLGVICVDNGSADGSADLVAREFPSVRLVRNDQNVGFAAAVNQAIAIALAEPAIEYVALVNSDLLVRPKALAALVDELVRDPRAGVVGPALRHPGGHLQSGAAGFAPTAWRGFAHFLFLSALTRGLWRGFVLSQRRRAGSVRPLPVDWVSGACLVARADAIRRAGMFDTRFFLYAEDVEWCCRVRASGFSVSYVPAVEAVHVRGASSPDGDPRWLAALCELVRRDRGEWEYRVFRVAAALGLALRRVAYGIAYRASGNERYRVLARDMRAYARWAAGAGGRDATP